mgnify:FL=1
MGILGKIFGGATASPIDALGNAFDKIFTSDEERQQAEALLEKLKQKPFLVQAEINKVAAAHRNWFVAGGRPALLWVAAIGWLMEFVINPIFQMASGKAFNMPVEQMVWLTGAVLGIYGGLRTVEKLKGKAQ